MSNNTKSVIVLTSILAFFIAAIIHIVAGIQFNRSYSGHLKRAADANSLKLAEKELVTAMKYLINNNYDTEEGRNQGSVFDHTSVIYSTPDEQISFHYQNISDSLEEVREVRLKGDKATPLERSNVLMKLRETLLDDSGSGQKATYPKGMHVYPWNAKLVFVEVFAVLACFLSWIFWDRR